MIYGMAFMMLSPVVPLYFTEQLELSYEQISAARVLIASLGVAGLGPLMGRLMDATGPVRLCILSFAVLGIYPLALAAAGLQTMVEIEPDFIKLDRSLIRKLDESMVKQKLVRTLRGFCREAGITVPAGDPRLSEILNTVKAREDEGYAYDGAQASFELVARRELGLCPEFFEVKRYRVTVERRKNKYNEMVTLQTSPTCEPSSPREAS